MATNMDLTQQQLKELLHYDPETGVFTWLVYRTQLSRVGYKAGWIQMNHAGKKYRSIEIKGRAYKAHRLAFFYMTGEWPVNQVDHEDGNGLHNWWGNLREATRVENAKNQKLHSRNTSGICGVNWDKGCKKWKSQITHLREKIYLGVFVCKADAIIARKMAEYKYNYHANHGSVRPI